jgi:uncharacterized repeat protein (TIGR01451 family)
MKNLLLSVAFLLLSATAAKAQLTGITPNQGALGQALTTTITGNGIFMTGFSPSGNIYSIDMIQGPNQFNVFWMGNWFGANVIDANTVTADFTVPLAQAPGVYDLRVIVGDIMDPQWNQTTYTLPGAFTVLPPDGYITGNVYNDVNRNGVKDVGETGVGYQYMRILPNNVLIQANSAGDYSYPATNGNYSVTFVKNSGNLLYNMAGNDTLQVTINNANSANNNFGLNTALISIMPPTAYRGMTTVHQIVSDKPIFATGAQSNGNINSLRIYSTPNINVPLASIQVIDSFTVQFTLTVYPSTIIGNLIDIRLYTTATAGSPLAGYHFLNDLFSIQIAPYTVSGRVYYDTNQNKVYDSGEPGINQARLEMAPQGSISFSDLNGLYSLGAFGGTQTVTYGNNLSNLVLFSDSGSYTMPVVSNITGKDFGLRSALPDYSISAGNGYIFPRCLTEQDFTFTVTNTSNIPYNATAWIKIHPLTTLISSPLPYTVSNDTVFFSISNLQPLTSTTITARFMLPNFPNTIFFIAGAWSLDANGVVQNTATFEKDFIIRCSFDPNDKGVTPPGIFAQNYTLMSDTLEYLIRFQNTGNDTAYKVVIVDTLDANLNLSTFELLGSSHNMMTEIKSNGEAKFTFNNIMLVDSTTNEPESHGFIRYRVRVNSGLPDGTPINNTAHIFFDFNEAVVTNTTLNTMVYVLPVGLNEAESQTKAVLYPNPFSTSATLHFGNEKGEMHSLMVTDITGKQVLPILQTNTSSIEIDKNQLTPGIYFYHLYRNGTSVANGKMVVK